MAFAILAGSHWQQVRLIPISSSVTQFEVFDSRHISTSSVPNSKFHKVSRNADSKALFDERKKESGEEISDGFKSAELSSNLKIGSANYGSESELSANRIETNSGGGTESASLESVFLSKLRTQLETRKRYPEMAKSMRIQGVVLVTFMLLKNGNISNVEVEPGASRLLQQAAKELVSSISGSLPIPETIEKSEWQIQVPIEYKLF